jgi:hypothetical protein
VLVNVWCKCRLDIAKRQERFETTTLDQNLTLDRTVGPCYAAAYRG